MRRRSRLYLTLIGLALLILGVGGFIFGSLISASVPLTSSARFPLGDPDSVDTDATGRIYVTDGFYKRVQRFTPSGDFEFGWYIDAAGPFRLRVLKDATIEVAVAKAESVLVYTADGRLATRRSLEVPFEQFASAMPPCYSIRGPLSLRPGLVRIRDGQRVLSDGLLLALVRGPFPAWCFAVIGIALLIRVQRKRRPGRAH